MIPTGRWTGAALVLLVCTGAAVLWILWPRWQVAPQASVDRFPNHQAVGCWELVVDSQRGHAELPSRMAITPDVEEGIDHTSGLLHRDEASRGPGMLWGAWIPYPGEDRIWIQWGDGLAGTYAKLRVSADTLQGPAYHWTDVAAPGRRGDVRWHRIECNWGEYAPVVDVYGEIQRAPIPF